MDDDNTDIEIDEPDLDGSPDEPDTDADNTDPSGAGGDDSNLDSEALRAELARVRREAANRRTSLRERESEVQTLQEQNRRILEALGIADDSDDDDPSVEAERLRAENRRLRTQSRFGSVARAAGADEDLAWGYLLARGEIDSLNPDAEDFDTVLRGQIDAALEAKPSLSVSAPTPPPGPSDFDNPNPPAEDPSDMEMKEYMEWRKKNRKQE